MAAIGHRLTELSTLMRKQVTEPPPVTSDAPTAAPDDAQHMPTLAPAPEPVEPTPQPAGHDALPSTRDEDTPAQPTARARWEPSRVLAWLGSAVTLLGVVFLLVLVVQRGWLSPELRVGGGAVLALLLVVAGWWSYRRPGGRAGGYALAATGFASLFLDVVAATTLYEYLPATAGLSAGLVVAVAGILLADRWRAQPFALGVVLGSAACAPLITQEPDARLVAFLLLLQIAAAPSQLRHDWRALSVTAAGPAVLASVIADLWSLQLPDPSATVWAAGATTVLSVLLAVARAVMRTDDSASVAMLVAAPAPALLAAPLLDRVDAGALAGAVTVLLFAVWSLARFAPPLRRRLPDRMRVAVAAVGMVSGLQTTMIAVDASSWGTVLLVEALLLAAGSHQLRSKAALLGATGYAGLGSFVALFHEIPPSVLLDTEHPGAEATGVPGVLAGLLVVLTAGSLSSAVLRLAELPKLPRVRPLWTLVGILLLYGTASAIMALVLLARADRTGFLMGHTLITLSWVAFAIILLLRGIRSPQLRVAGLVLIGMSLLKLFLFDLATLDGIARVIAFLCAGLVLLAAGVRYARLVTADQKDVDDHSGSATG